MQETRVSFTHEIEVTGAQLVDAVDRLLAAGDIALLQLRSEKGDLCLTLPHAGGHLDSRWVGVVIALSKMLPKLTIRVARTSHAPSIRAAPEPAGAE